MTKRHSWPIRAILFSGAMAFCLAPAMAQDHGDKDGHDKTEHVDKSHKDGGHKDAGHGGDAHGGEHGAHGNDAHGGAAHGGPGGHDGHGGDHHGGVLGAVGKLVGGGHHDGHAGPERNPHHHFTYGGKSHEAFNGPAFHWPHGHGYHRRHVGWAMPLLFLTAQYILHDYGMYGLEPPPPGAEWVRYGPDIMLVDRHNGHVIKVIYGAFAP